MEHLNAEDTERFRERHDEEYNFVSPETKTAIETAKAINSILDTFKIG